jgi:hypothetical protein
VLATHQRYTELQMSSNDCFQLKKRFGKGYKLTIHCEQKYEAKAHKYINDSNPTTDISLDS